MIYELYLLLYFTYKDSISYILKKSLYSFHVLRVLFDRYEHKNHSKLIDDLQFKIPDNFIEERIEFPQEDLI